MDEDYAYMKGYHTLTRYYNKFGEKNLILKPDIHFLPSSSSLNS